VQYFTVEGPAIEMIAPGKQLLRGDDAEDAPAGVIPA
jgi:hypothetical protein